MNKFNTLFGDKKALIAMIHIGATPGSPKYCEDVKKNIKKAVTEAEIYKKAGIATVMIENMHDVPYLNKEIGHEVSTLMAIIGYEIKRRTSLNCGIQILAGANKQALATANSAGLDFIRSESYVFSHIADEGIMHSDAGELKRYQKQIGADNILIFTDIKKKHSSHTLTSDISIIETAKAVEFFLSDGVIITGDSTGKPADTYEVKVVKKNVNILVLIGSGITSQNISEYYNIADAFIIGSYFKEKGYWANKPDIARISEFIRIFNNL